MQDLSSNRTSRKQTSESLIFEEQTEKDKIIIPAPIIPNNKPKYLFYRTPSNKDNKKIDFNNTNFTSQK